MEMGFIKGRKITALLVAPLRDPVKYRLMNYEVSLRRAEANMIEVMPLAPAENTAVSREYACGRSGAHRGFHPLRGPFNDGGG